MQVDVMWNYDEYHIKKKAEEIWNRKGRPEGCDKQNWEEAIKELGWN